MAYDIVRRSRPTAIPVRPLFSWSVIPPAGRNRGRGAVGVTDDPKLAMAHVEAELQSAPVGSRALVHKVLPSLARIAYIYEALVARSRVDARSGAVVWELFSKPSAWGRQRHARVTDPPDTSGDAIPPEAIAGGLADGETYDSRRQLAGL